MDAENSNKLTNKYSKKKVLEMLVIILVTAVIWNLPLNSFGIDGLTIVQQRVIAIFVFATLSWLTEAIPSWATSLVIITSMCLTVSNNSISCFKETGAKLSANGSELAMTKDITFTSGVYCQSCNHAVPRRFRACYCSHKVGSRRSSRAQSHSPVRQ